MSLWLLIRSTLLCVGTKDIWTPFVGEELQCGRAGNIHDLHMVATNKPGTGIVGHVKREISAPCDVFLLGCGVITCIITAIVTIHWTIHKVAWTCHASWFSKVLKTCLQKLNLC